MIDDSKRRKRSPESLAQKREAHDAARKAHLEDIKARKAASKERAKGGRQRERWTAEEDRLLAFLWGEFPLTTIARRLSRSVEAVRLRAHRQHLPPQRQGTHSIHDISRATGYGDTRLHGAISVLRVGRRASHLARSPWMFTDEEVAAIGAYLATIPDGEWLYVRNGRRVRQGDWGVRQKPAACLGCQRADVRHYSNNKCKTCFRESDRQRRADSRARLASVPPHAEPHRRAA